MRTQTFIASLLAAAALGAASQPVVAQQQVARLYVVKPHPGHEMQFEEALAAHAEWRRENNDPWSWSVAQVVAGDDLGLWYIRSGGHQWADFDTYDAGFALPALEHWMNNVNQHVANTASMVTTSDTTNVRWPEDPSAIRFVTLIDFYLRPGQQQAFFEVVNKFHEAIVQTEFPAYYSFNWSAAGGPGNMIRLALPYESWADMAPPETTMAAMVADVYGPEEAQALNERFDNTLRRSQSTVLMIRPDLSVNMDM